MKKNYLFGMALMASLAFYSCDKEAINVQDGEGVESVADGAQVIALQVEDGGDGLTTRTRPLYSAEAKEDIGKVKVMIYDGGGSCVRSKTIDDWKSSPAGEKMIELAGEEKLAQGRYTVYAVGYSKDNNEINDISIPTLNNGELVFPSCGTKDEIFAGKLGLEVMDGVGFKKTITMSRQVAGVYIYVKGIPYVSPEACCLKLYASGNTNSLVVGKLPGEEGENKYVVNGNETTYSGGETEFEILSINLKDWFGGSINMGNDNLIDDQNWNNPYGASTSYVEGAVFGGAFVFPFKYAGGKQTLTLALTDEMGSNRYKTWNVNLNENDDQLLNKVNLMYWSDRGWDSFGNESESKNDYSLLRNHLYGVGTKKYDSNPGGGTPEEDNPATLNTKQELVLTVNPDWNVVHGMELD